MAPSETELQALHHSCEQKILEAIQRHRGVKRHAWHDQHLFIRPVEEVQGGWRVGFSFMEDDDNCSQYDKSIQWEGEAFFEGDIGTVVLRRGSFWVTEAGVASGVKQGKKLQLCG